MLTLSIEAENHSCSLWCLLFIRRTYSTFGARFVIGVLPWYLFWPSFFQLTSVVCTSLRRHWFITGLGFAWNSSKGKCAGKRLSINYCLWRSLVYSYHGTATIAIVKHKTSLRSRQFLWRSLFSLQLRSRGTKFRISAMSGMQASRAGAVASRNFPLGSEPARKLEMINRNDQGTKTLNFVVGVIPLPFCSFF